MEASSFGTTWTKDGRFLHGFQSFAAYIGVAGIYRGGMDNDGIHKFAYRLRALFTDLLRLVAPALEKELDFDRAVELPTSRIEPAGGRLAQRHGDIAWRVPRRDAGDDGWGAWVVVLVEFQSTVHWNMAERMREYSHMARRMQQRRKSVPAAWRGCGDKQRSSSVCKRRSVFPSC